VCRAQVRIVILAAVLKSHDMVNRAGQPMTEAVRTEWH
jgi:hypothetical protein